MNLAVLPMYRNIFFKLLIKNDHPILDFKTMVNTITFKHNFCLNYYILCAHYLTNIN